MTSLLQAPALDYCQKSNNIRGRRLSLTPSVDYGCTVNQLRGRRFSLSSPPPPQGLKGEARDTFYNDNAVDDTELPVLDKDEAAPALPSPLCDAHVPGYSTNVHIPRHQVAVAALSSSNTVSDTSPIESTRKAASVIEVREAIDQAEVLPENLKRRLISAFFVYFLCGWGDGVTGTVLPYLMAEFHLTDMTSSLLFTGTTVGFFLGTLSVERVSHVLGFFDLNTTQRSIVPAFPFLYRFPTLKRSRVLLGFSPSQSRYVTMLVACIVHSNFFVLMGVQKGFSAMFMAYVIASFARAFLTANLDLYLSTQGPKAALGYAFGFWSLGGVCAPIVCQSIIATGAPWPNFYFGSLVVSGVNLCLVAYAFRPTLKEFYTEQREALRVRSESRSIPVSEGKGPRVESSIEMGYSDGESSPSSSTTTIEVPEAKNTLHRALRMPHQWAFSAFAWLYYGCEAAFQGFIISYLLSTRQANPKTVGYVTSGFWGGETVGRFLWGYFASRLSFTQRKYIMIECLTKINLAAALVMHILIWFVNSNIENAFSACIIGLMYGPVWPASLTMTSEVLPKDVQMVSMALLSALGNIGSALFPFITGAIANKKGVQYLPYLTVPQVAALLCVLVFLPSKIPIKISS